MFNNVQSYEQEILDKITDNQGSGAMNYFWCVQDHHDYKLIQEKYFKPKN
jgi:hypothetical protein